MLKVSIKIFGWNVSSVSDMVYMAESFNQDISGWNVSSVNDMMYMFDNADGLSDDNKCYIHEKIPVKPGNMTGENTALMIEENLR